MGSRSIGTSGTVPRTGKGPATFSTPKRPPPDGCPETVSVVGGAHPSIAAGDDAALSLANDQPQLVVSGHVVPSFTTTPSIDRLTRCLQEGESYLGRVTSTSTGRFEASLSGV